MVLIVLAGVASFIFLALFLPVIQGQGLQETLITVVNTVTPGMAQHIPNFFGG